MRLRRLAFCAALLGALVAALPLAASADEGEDRPVMRVRLDEATVLHLTAPAQTLIIGNPSIADAIVHGGNIVIVTGKSFGTTNLIAIDRKGNVVVERQIEVGQPASGTLTVQRGDDLETYNCAPTCRRSPVIGDTLKVFNDTIAQTQARNGLALSQAR